jgi:hypothetical protein
LVRLICGILNVNLRSDFVDVWIRSRLHARTGWFDQLIYTWILFQHLVIYTFLSFHISADSVNRSVLVIYFLMVLLYINPFEHIYPFYEPFRNVLTRSLYVSIVLFQLLCILLTFEHMSNISGLAEEHRAYPT